MMVPTWFFGVVEDRFDPLKLGRCRVRCVGYHTENKQELPTNDLPWAYPITPINSASISGKGDTPIGPLEGTWIVGFFRDGDQCQDPVMMGTVGGIPMEPPNPNKGFNDPKGVYPSAVGEPDTNKLARGEPEGTIVDIKKQGLDTMVTASGIGVGQKKEPESPYAAQYPFNEVRESEAGHIIEVDNTPGAERLHTYHKSGTFEEIHPDGSKVEKIQGNNYTVIAGENDVHIKGSCNVSLDGGCNVLVNGPTNFKCLGNVDYKVSGCFSVSSTGAIKLTAGASSLILNPGACIIRAPSILLN
jgi:hypothetical protein